MDGNLIITSVNDEGKHLEATYTPGGHLLDGDISSTTRMDLFLLFYPIYRLFLAYKAVIA